MMLKYLVILALLCSQQFVAQELLSKPDLEAGFKPSKMLVICLSPEETFRTNFENMMKHSLDFHSVKVTSSHLLLPEKIEPTQQIEKGLATLIESLSERKFNSLMISAVTNIEAKKIGDAYLYDEFTLYHFTTNVYKINNENLTLIWEMCLSLYGIQLQHMSTIDIVNEIVDKLAKDEIIPQKPSFTQEVYTIK